MIRKTLSILTCAILIISILSGCSDKSTPAGVSSPAPTVISPSATENRPASSNESPAASIEPGVPADVITRPGPADILPRLEQAYNAQDLLAIVECFEPSVSNMLWGTLSVASGIAGVQISPDSLKSIMPFASQALGMSGLLEDGNWGTVSLAPVRDNINGARADLTYTATVTYANGSRNSIEETIQTVQVDGVWYIAAFQSGWLDSDPVTARERHILDEVFEGELFPASRNGRWGFTDVDGNIIIPIEYREAYAFSEGLARVRADNDLIGFINARNEFVIQPEYPLAEDFKDGLAVVNVGARKDSTLGWRGGQWGFVDKTGNMVIPAIYSNYGIVFDGVIPMKYDNDWGIIDTRGNTVVDFIYHSMGFGDAAGYVNADRGDRFFYNGTIGVSINDAWGVINASGDFIVPLSRENYYAPVAYPEGFIFIPGNTLSSSLGTVYSLNGTILAENVRSVQAFDDGSILVLSRASDEIGSSGSGITHDWDALIINKSGIVNKVSSNASSSPTDTYSQARAHNYSFVFNAPAKWCVVQFDRKYNFVNSSGQLKWDGGTDDASLIMRGPYHVVEARASLAHSGSDTKARLNFRDMLYIGYAYDMRTENADIVASADLYGFFDYSDHTYTIDVNYDSSAYWNPIESATVTRASDGATWEFGEIEPVFLFHYTNQYIHWDRVKAFIVQDVGGIFYGLFTEKDGLLYDTVYTSARYNEGANTVSLTRGNDTTVVWICPNGNAFEIS